MEKSLIDIALQRGPEFPERAILAGAGVVANLIVDPLNFAPVRIVLSAFNNEPEIADRGGNVRRALEVAMLPLGALSVGLGAAYEALYSNESLKR
ncbi:MAG: hypothetical protein US89_C0007G0048 [Candidatus Peregrinibacteria bacterium GW2011_GWF2_38_29]|nr:MAG: hypothetical protein US89_C0007G0048 [Candidatus Peregrinibacteria bacterium GW2011_GWF2_38_29]HBB02864.1 hypothetical protein [Candidatus Peregrinibacteria bacterium]